MATSDLPTTAPAVRGAPGRRVVHLTTVHNPHDTRILYRECRSIAANGYDVTLVACAPEDFEVDGVTVHALHPPAGRNERLTRTAAQCLRTALSLDADLYHFHDPELAPWLLVLRARGKPVVFDVHENIVASLSNRKWIHPILRPIMPAATEATLRMLMGAFHIVFAEHSYPMAYPWVKDYEIVCNFPPLDAFDGLPAAEKFDRFSVVYLGSITRERGLIETLEALKLLSDRGVAVDFHVIGQFNRDKSSDTQALFNGYNLENVVVYDYMPQPKALEIVSRCHVGLAILHPVRNYTGSYPTKLFEYMGCGLPFIASSFPLYQELAQEWDCGVTVDPRSPTALADAIEMIFRCRERATLLGANGRQAVRIKYNWREQEYRLLQLYDRILGRSDSAARFEAT